MVEVSEVGALRTEVGAPRKFNFRNNAAHHTNLAPTFAVEVGAEKVKQFQEHHQPHHPNQPIYMKRGNGVNAGARGARKGFKEKVGRLVRLVQRGSR